MEMQYIMTKKTSSSCEVFTAPEVAPSSKVYNFSVTATYDLLSLLEAIHGFQQNLPGVRIWGYILVC